MKENLINNTYAAIFLEDTMVGVINLANPDSAHDGLHTALEEHTDEEWDLDFETPEPSDIAKGSMLVHMLNLERDQEYDIKLIQTWIY